jgi:hypothetical protein
VGDNDVFSAAVRDILAGFAMGGVGSTVTDTLTGQQFEEEESNKWWAGGQNRAFEQVQPDNPYYNKYAQVFWQYTEMRSSRHTLYARIVIVIHTTTEWLRRNP